MYKVPEGIEERDLGQWVGRGVLVYTNPKTGESRVVRVPHPTEGSMVVAEEVTTGERMRCAYASLSIMWPDCGSINLPGSPAAVYVRRRQRRQYTRAFNFRCVDVRVPGAWWVNRYFGRRLNPSLYSDRNGEFVRSLFFPEYPEGADEADQILQGAASVALCRELILVNSDPHRLYYKGQYAGPLGAGDDPWAINEDRAVDTAVSVPAARRLERFLRGKP